MFLFLLPLSFASEIFCKDQSSVFRNRLTFLHLIFYTVLHTMYRTACTSICTWQFLKNTPRNWIDYRRQRKLSISVECHNISLLIGIQQIMNKTIPLAREKGVFLNKHFNLFFHNLHQQRLTDSLRNKTST